MVKDIETGECFRADHLIKNAAEALINVSKFMTGYDYTFLEQEDE
jgi:glycyl-tRNA synthetase (class II)